MRLTEQRSKWVAGVWGTPPPRGAALPIATEPGLRSTADPCHPGPVALGHDPQPVPDRNRALLIMTGKLVEQCKSSPLLMVLEKDVFRDVHGRSSAMPRCLRLVGGKRGYRSV